ncbi:hemolysin D [Flavobacterium noncentrifugens]|uniref:HlyD family secretion protein n=1 Tax=Flavobacterium noncentrifugens TaxID=1128970 RepID=A0A1G8WZX4_9FLAO|nr:efflux RND transporter periplasmic adaptor subunit [Flavobacterium noncentrifugens]GEP51090.1 hemolysin D [Flavobacterium noncentrifugens]SDJ83080.1 HlyD family secretion protein [Flavobacterium noncentrifugens]
MKKWIIISATAVFIIAIAIYAFSHKKAAVITFETARSHYGSISKSVTATGTIQPIDTVSVGAQVSGVVRNIYADYNSIVKKGQLLAKIDPSIILEQAQAAQANVANAQSNLSFQQSNFAMQEKLYRLDVISKSDYELAQNQYNVAKASLQNATAQLRITKKNLSYTDIYSPIDGMVLNRNVSEGQTIASSFNAPTLFVIAKDLTKMQVRAAVDEADIGEVRSGQNVSFTVDAFPDEIFKGSVQQILLHAKVSANVVTYTTLINVDNSLLKLKPGMTASINIYTQEDDSALLIPSKALVFKPDSTVVKQFVIVPFKNEKAKQPGNPEMQSARVWIKSGDTLFEKRIGIDMTDDINVKVISGLTEGRQVITNTKKANEESAKTSTQTSPFMPKMGSRKTSKSNK